MAGIIGKSGIYPRAELHKRHISESLKKYKKTRRHRENLSKSLLGKFTGKRSFCWKGGICEDIKKYRRDYNREWRHRLGIHKKYSPKYGGPKLLTRRESHLLRKHNMRSAGELTIQTIQKVYEENIKCFGALSCIYCFKLIQFGQDSLEHIIPISKKGTNEYENLAIACIHCNKSKHNKTLEEWLK